MKKIVFAAMICCVAMMGITFTSCNNNKPEELNAKLLTMDPCLNWGCNLAEVQQHMQAKSWWKNGNDSLELWSDLGWHKWYYVAENITEQYLFETEDGKNLQYAECYCRDANIPYSQGKLLLEKWGCIYMSKGTTMDNDPYDLYLSKDKASNIYHINSGDDWYFFFEPARRVD